MKLRRVAAALLAGVLAVTAAGCGAKDGQAGETSVVAAKKAAHYFKADYLENLPDSFTNVNKYGFVGDVLYYSSYGKDYSAPLVGTINILTGENKVVWQKDEKSKQEVSITAVCGDDEGNTYLIANVTRLKDEVIERYADATEDDIIQYLYENWGMGSREEAEDYWHGYSEEVLKNATVAEVMAEMNADYENDYIHENTIKKFDQSGAEQFSIPFEINAAANVQSMCTDKDGNLLVLINEYTEDIDAYYVTVLGSDGSKKGDIKIDTYAESICRLSDGRVAYTDTSDMSAKVVILDAATVQKGEEITLTGSGYISDVVQMSDAEYLVNDSNDAVKINVQTGENEKYFTWLDSNIMGTDVREFTMLSDGRIGVYMETYGADGSNCELAVLHEISEEEANAVTPINVVCFYASYKLRAQALDFNRKHSDYRISITEYYDYADESVKYEDALNSFVTDCATDSGIDIIMCESYSQMLDFADKGLLVDLKQYMTGDGEVNADTIIPAVLDACTYKGSLAALPADYSVRTLMAKAAVAGGDKGWTTKQCLDAVKATNPKEIIPYTDRATALSYLVSLNYKEFIDLENATCNFNNEDFQGVLELSAEFPQEYQYDDESNELDDFITGKVLTRNVSLPDFREAPEAGAVCGEKVSYLGYPTSNGNGAMMSLSSIMGITSNCKNPTVAWDFMHNMFIPEEESSGEYYNGSILKTELDKYFESAKTWTDRGTVDVEGHEVELKTPTDEEINEMRSLMEGATAVMDSVPTSIMNIISEEAAAYYSGEKLASDVAAVVQSRVDIYLSETR